MSLGRVLKFFNRFRESSFNGHLLHGSIVFNKVDVEGRWGRISIDEKRKG